MNYLHDDYDDMMYLITNVDGIPPEIQVSGEILPLDNTAPFLTGLNSISVWMIPAVAGVAGAGVYFLRNKKH